MLCSVKHYTIGAGQQEGISLFKFPFLGKILPLAFPLHQG